MTTGAVHIRFGRYAFSCCGGIIFCTAAVTGAIAVIGRCRHDTLAGFVVRSTEIEVGTRAFIDRRSRDGGIRGSSCWPAAGVMTGPLKLRESRQAATSACPASGYHRVGSTQVPRNFRLHISMTIRAFRTARAIRIMRVICVIRTLQFAYVPHIIQIQRVRPSLATCARRTGMCSNPANISSVSATVNPFSLHTRCPTDLCARRGEHNGRQRVRSALGRTHLEIVQPQPRQRPGPGRVHCPGAWCCLRLFDALARAHDLQNQDLHQHPRRLQPPSAHVMRNKHSGTPVMQLICCYI